MASKAKQSKIDFSHMKKTTSKIDKMPVALQGVPFRTNENLLPKTSVVSKMKMVERTAAESPPTSSVDNLPKMKSALQTLRPVVKFESLMSAKIDTTSGFVKGTQSIKKGSILRKVKLDDLLIKMPFPKMKNVNVSLAKSPEVMASNVLRMNLDSANKDRTETHSHLSQASGAPGDMSHKTPLLPGAVEKTKTPEIIKTASKISDEQPQKTLKKSISDIEAVKTSSGVPGLVNYADVLIEKPLDIRLALERQLRQKKIVQILTISTVILLCIFLLIMFIVFLSGSAVESDIAATVDYILNSTTYRQSMNATSVSTVNDYDQ